MSTASQLVELDKDVVALAEKLAVLRTAVCELALTSNDFHSLRVDSPFHGSDHVREHLRRKFPTLEPLVRAYLADPEAGESRDG